MPADIFLFKLVKINEPLLFVNMVFLTRRFFFFLICFTTSLQKSNVQLFPREEAKKKRLPRRYLSLQTVLRPAFSVIFYCISWGGRTADLPKHNLSSIEGSTSFWTIWIPCCFVIAFSYFVFIDLAFVQASHPATDVGIATENIRLPLVQFRNQIKTLTFLRTVRHFVVRSGRGVVEGT